MTVPNKVYRTEDGRVIDFIATLTKDLGAASEITEGYVTHNHDGSITFYPSGTFFLR